MSRDIKFRAYIPKLNMMLPHVAVFSNGDVGIYISYFEEKLKEERKDHFVEMMEDFVEYCPCVVQHNPKKKIYNEIVLKFLSEGDQWMIIDKEDCIICQSTNMFDCNGVEIFEGDIVEVTTTKKRYTPIPQKSITSMLVCVIGFEGQGLIKKIYNSGKIIAWKSLIEDRRTIETVSYKVVGNEYQD